MKYFTLKQYYNTKSNDRRDAYRIATTGANIKRVSVKKMKHATEILNELKTLRRLNEYALNYDNDARRYTVEGSAKLEKKQEQQAQYITELLKKYKINLYIDTGCAYAKLSTKADARTDLYLNCYEY